MLSEISVKDEVADSRGSSEQGEVEMEVESNDEQEDESGAKASGGAFSQTLSTLSTLKPGMFSEGTQIKKLCAGLPAVFSMFIRQFFCSCR